MSKDGKNNETKTYFRITGDFEPDDITNALNLEPCTTWKKGERRKRLGREACGNYTFSAWEFGEIEKVNNNFANEQMRETIAPLLEKIEVLKRLKQEYGLNYTLEIVPKFYAATEKPILSPPREVIDFCSSIGADIDIDYYFYFDD